MVDGIEVCTESEKMAEFVKMKLKKDARKFKLMEPESVRKRDSALLKAVVKAHL